MKDFSTTSICLMSINVSVRFFLTLLPLLMFAISAKSDWTTICFSTIFLNCCPSDLTRSICVPAPVVKVFFNSSKVSQWNSSSSSRNLPSSSALSADTGCPVVFHRPVCISNPIRPNTNLGSKFSPCAFWRTSNFLHVDLSKDR